MKGFAELIAKAQARGRRVCVVARAEDESVLEGIKLAGAHNMIAPILIGAKRQIEAIAGKVGLGLADTKIIDCEDEEQVMRQADTLTREQNGVLMKGQIATSTFLKGVLNKEYGLRTGRILSHVAVLEIPAYHKLLLMSDGGMNPKLDLRIRVDIIRNALELAHAMGIAEPRVALIAASESVNPEMPETVDAVEIVKMAQGGEISGARIEGPFGFDVAVSREAAVHKKMKSEIAGDVDILIMPNISAGNIWAKGLMYFAKAKAAGTVMGASYGVVMLSRADPPEAKLHSIALGILSSP